MEDDLLVSSGTRAFREQLLVNDRQTGKGMVSLRAATSAGRTPPSYLRCFIYLSSEFQYPISRILNQACSISNNLLSYILLASDRTESSTSPPGAWALSTTSQVRYLHVSTIVQVLWADNDSAATRLARCRRLWSTAANTQVCGHWTSVTSFASSSVHFIIFSPAGGAIWDFGLGQSRLFVARDPIAINGHFGHIWPFMAIWPIWVFFECALRVHWVVRWPSHPITNLEVTYSPFQYIN